MATDLPGTNAIPNPGSDEARGRGCSCPVLDNGRGRGWMGGAKDEDGSTLFVYTVGCPVHCPEPRTLKGRSDD